MPVQTDLLAGRSRGRLLELQVAGDAADGRIGKIGDQFTHGVGVVHLASVGQEDNLAAAGRQAIIDGARFALPESVGHQPDPASLKLGDDLVGAVGGAIRNNHDVSLAGVRQSERVVQLLADDLFLVVRDNQERNRRRVPIILPDRARRETPTDCERQGIPEIGIKGEEDARPKYPQKCGFVVNHHGLANGRLGPASRSSAFR